MIQPETIAGRYRFYERRRAERNASWYVADGVVHIPLVSGHEALIDERDLELASAFVWCVMRSRGGTYVAATVPVAMQEKWPYRYIKLHHLILGITDGSEVDHKDRNGLNCCRNNLRAATRSQNGANRVWPRGAKSKYRGIAPTGKKWLAHIQFKRKQIHLGVFPTEEEAALAYNAAAVLFFGEFSVLNQIEAGH
jgi:hypothetical protein